MTKVVSIESWRVLEDTILLSDEANSAYKMRLAKTKGEVMRYGEWKEFVIDFPGEYERDGIGVRCREAWGSLHYILRFDSGELVALLLNPKSVEHDALKSATLYLCADEDTKDRIEQNEFEWEVTVVWEGQE
jgi:hypothetical protein